MKNKLKILMLSMIIVLVSGCSNSGQATVEDERKFIEIEDEYVDGVLIIEVKDRDTGVHYLITDDGITVMYNADGTIKAD